MKLLIDRAPRRNAGLLAAAIWLGALAAPAAAQGLPYRVSELVRTSVLAARGAIAQNNFAGATAALVQAEAAARTDGDRYVIATVRLDVANRSYNADAQRAAVDALISSPLIDDARRADLLYHRARLANQAQDTAGARDALIESIRRGSTDPRVHIALADLYTRSNAHVQSLELIARAIELQTASGQPAPVFWYRRAIDISQRANNAERGAQFSHALLRAYPQGRNWRDVLLYFRNAAPLDPVQTLDLMRLLNATGGLSGEHDYLDYAQLANAAEHPAEIERVVAAGRAAGMIATGNAEIAALDRGTTRAAETLRGAIGARATAAAGAATGAEAFAVAADYMALGQYTEAAPLYRTALAKGGVDADLANLRLGMALARSGQPDAARAALALAGGRQAWLARFWTIYAESRAPSPVAPAPAAG